MLAKTTHNDTDSLVWSPERDKMAYVTAEGLQVYISSRTNDEERYIKLSGQGFSELSWSSTGDYLAGLDDRGVWHIFRFIGMHVDNIYGVEASSLDWFGENAIVYVPHAGGLVLVDLHDTLHEIRLAG